MYRGEQEIEQASDEQSEQRLRERKRVQWRIHSQLCAFFRRKKKHLKKKLRDKNEMLKVLCRDF